MQEMMEYANKAVEEPVEDAIPTKKFIPREYQEEILECAQKENTIACLGTGTGKTYIAVMLIKALSEDVRLPFSQGGKKTIFLVPTVPLVTQQANVLMDHTDLKIGKYFGAMGIDFWSNEEWHTQFEKFEVLVMTAEIFRVIIQHAFLKLSQVNLIVFDECHRAVGNHPYMEIMRCFHTTPAKEQPKILGLTASILNGKCKPSKVEDTLRDLEMTLMSVGRVTKNLLAYNKFGTRPKQFIVYYNPTNIAEDIPDFEFVFNAIHNACIRLYDKSTTVMKDISKYMTETEEAFTTLGPWCAMTLAQQYTEEIARMLRNSDLTDTEREKCRICHEELEMIYAIILSLSDGNLLLTTISPKLKKLLEILKSSKIWDRNNMCSIVFVRKRITASILCRWLDTLSKTVPEYDFIRCNFVVGHGATSIKELAGMEMSTRKQCQIISDFHDRKYNLIIATSVIEEGLDVPQCNLVVRFDLPMDYRSYIQSKGRARAKKSLYVLMVSTSESSSILPELTDYNITEEILYRRCFDRQQPTQEEIVEHFDVDEVLPPYMPVKEDGCPRITMSSAISLVNRYCTLLPRSTTSHLRPKYETKETDTCLQNGPLFQCTLYLPMNSPLKEPVIGEVMASKRLAEMAAALKACELLHINGELDGHLLPRDADDVSLSDDDDDDDDDKSDEVIQIGKKGTKKRVKYYPKQIADALCGKPPNASRVCFLYMVSLKLVDVRAGIERNTHNDPLKTTRGFGILSTKQIPTVRSFPLFIHAGQAKVELSLIKSGVTISQEQLDNVKLFHQTLFEDALQVTKNQIFDPESAGSSYYIVPINSAVVFGSEISSWTIDWDFLKHFRTKHERYQKQKNLNARQFDFREEDYLDAVVINSHRNKADQGFFYVCGVVDDLTPRSVMPDTNVTFESYYLRTYHKEIFNKSQPLLQILSMKNPLLIFPTYLTTKLKRCAPKTKQKEKRRLYFVPELIAVHPLPATLWFKALTLPCILHRLNYLLLANQLRVQAISSFGIGQKMHTSCWPLVKLPENKADTEGPLDHGDNPDFGQLPTHNDYFCIKKYPSVEMQDAVELEEWSGPALDVILSALTTKNATDIIDLERLELVGDAFLKYASSEYMFMTYSKFNEGKLTTCKMRQIGNKKLVSLAKARNLTSWLVARKFEPRGNFLVPGFSFPRCLERAFSRSGIPEKFWDAFDLPSELGVENVAKHIEKCKHLYEKLKPVKQQSESRRAKVDEGIDISLIDDHVGSAEEILEIESLMKDFVNFKPLTIHHVSDKTVADSVEALIGAYLVSGGREAALFFMSWLGLKVMKDTHKETLRDGFLPADAPICDRFKVFDIPPSPLIKDDYESLDMLDKLLKGLNAIETTLGYTFQDKAYLVQSVTHPTCTDNRVTDCYERLEFLGDAILDYLITKYLYNDPKNYDPGHVTDVRAALVNNSILAELAVKYDFNVHLKYSSSELFGIVGRYVHKTKRLTMNEAESVSQMEEEECETLEEIQVPKVLADIFEALIGAVYLDSNRNLDEVWKVIYKLMGEVIEKFKENPPKDSVRLLLENYPMADLKYATEEIGNGKFKKTIAVEGRTFSGMGRNKKLALKAACKRALRVLVRNVV